MGECREASAPAQQGPPKIEQRTKLQINWLFANPLLIKLIMRQTHSNEPRWVPFSSWPPGIVHCIMISNRSRIWWNDVTQHTFHSYKKIGPLWLLSVRPVFAQTSIDTRQCGIYIKRWRYCYFQIWSQQLVYCSWCPRWLVKMRPHLLWLIKITMDLFQR